MRFLEAASLPRNIFRQLGRLGWQAHAKEITIERSLWSNERPKGVQPSGWRSYKVNLAILVFAGKVTEYLTDG